MSLDSKKIKPTTFKLYESTSTGTVQDTKAGTPLWKNPKVLGLCGVLVCLFAFLLTRSIPALFAGKPPEQKPLVAPLNPAVPSAPPPAAAPVAVAAVPPVPADSSHDGVQRKAGPGPLDDYEFRVVSEVIIPGDRVIRFRVYRPGTDEYFHYYERDLLLMGYELKRFAFCSYLLTSPGGAQKMIGCPKRDSSFPNAMAMRDQ